MTGLIVHEWIAQSGGSERVLDAIIKSFPGADIYCLWNDDANRYGDRKVFESWIAATPLRRHKALAVPAIIPTWRMVKPLHDYEWMIVSSHMFAHHCHLRGVRREIPKYVYAHTPARYIWAPSIDRRGNNVITRAGSALLRPLDRRRAQEATAVAANSIFTRDRIRKAWHVDATVIYPPVDVDRILAVDDWSTEVNEQEAGMLATLPDSFLLGASRFVSYKRLDLVIHAGESVGIPVVLAGSGPDEDRLRRRASLATVPVIFVRRPSDQLLYALYQRALVYVFPPIEDFGIMPVEAMAAGAPVIVSARGGSRESVVQTGAGVELREWTSLECRRAVNIAASMDKGKGQRAARSFSLKEFNRKIRKWATPPRG